MTKPKQACSNIIYGIRRKSTVMSFLGIEPEYIEVKEVIFGDNYEDMTINFATDDIDIPAQFHSKKLVKTLCKLMNRFSEYNNFEVFELDIMEIKEYE